MRISKFLIASLVFSTSIVGASFGAGAAEPEKPSSMPMGGSPSAPLGAPSVPTGGTPAAQADPSAPTGGSSSPAAPSDPSATPSTPSESPSPAPSGGGTPSSDSSSSSSGTVLATCGPGNATFVFDSTDQAPVGCRVSAINAPPAAALK